LDPAATWRSTLALIPALTIFLSILLLGRRARRLLAIGVVSFIFASVLLGLAQLAQGPGSPLRFYEVTNPGDSVGFFANRNHFAALLYCGLPLVAALVVGVAENSRREAIIGVALCVLAFASLLLGLGMARSRAGLVLAMIGGVIAFGLALQSRSSDRKIRAHRVLYISGAIGAVLVLQFAAVGILQRFQADVTEDLRWEFSRTTMKAAAHFLPLGTGFGTFEDVYRIFETTGQLRSSYVNHAHNDYAELLLEGGVPAALILLTFLAWFCRQALACWQQSELNRGIPMDLALPKAGSAIALLLVLHSAVDYPLRTTAMSCVFAMACAFMCNPLRVQSGTDASHACGRRRDHGAGTRPRPRKDQSRPALGLCAR
jgi:O-antigen ligase